MVFDAAARLIHKRFGNGAEISGQSRSGLWIEDEHRIGLIKAFGANSGQSIPITDKEN